jgi:BirA family transcriptional regulator, biotin operon repressor / biotin---[acetyl-CoA-carboxylase] ligase
MHFDVSFIADHFPDRPIYYFPTIGSTMTEATRLAASDAPHGTLVIADAQTAGVGRFGRQWYSEPETGIYCSIVLRPSISPATLPIMTLLLGLATAEAIERSAGLACDLRWPNDVLINDLKVAGILAQLEPPSVIAGIGINVNQTALPANLRTPSTSLRLAAKNRQFSRERIVVQLLHSIDTFCKMLEVQGAESILQAFTAASSYVLHRRVQYERGQGVDSGVTAGLDEKGFLRVRDDSGLIHTIYTGSVRPSSPRT